MIFDPVKLYETVVFVSDGKINIPLNDSPFQEVLAFVVMSAIIYWLWNWVSDFPNEKKVSLDESNPKHQELLQKYRQKNLDELKKISATRSQSIYTERVYVIVEKILQEHEKQ